MAFHGLKAATTYGYANARVKAMQSRLLLKGTIRDLINTRDASGMLSLLMSTEYKEDIEAFGGMKVKRAQIDFALSKNLAKNVVKLVELTPSGQKPLIRDIVGRWDISNIKLAIEAKARGMRFEDVSSSIIDAGVYGAKAVREFMSSQGVEELLERMLINSPYRAMLSNALQVYRKTGSIVETEMAIDRSYYAAMGQVIKELSILSPESARVLRMDMDMKNILLLIRAKHYGADFQGIAQNIVAYGSIGIGELEAVYNGSKDLDSLVRAIKVFDLAKALEVYKSTGSKQLLTFEIAMRNQIFNKGVELLSGSTLSFGSIMTYFYLKEIEVFTLRIAINGLRYGLEKNEILGMMVWKAE
ncbi:MAG: V-type ATPase subunit [Candidatus Micrarchaeales archaeon]|nr:V-type ATPase subunit [Candidatus Micrarchaeales archaeon]